MNSGSKLASAAVSDSFKAIQVERDKEHDMRALKRQDVLALRQGAAKGCKVFCIWDRAGIDFAPFDAQGGLGKMFQLL